MNTRRTYPSLALILSLVAACAGPSESTQASASATPEPTVAATEQPSPTLTPTPEPSVEAGARYATYGALATVAVDRLRLRPSPSTEFDPIATLEPGDELLVVEGPITANGYSWYYVHIPADEPSATRDGWVAAIPADAGPNPPDDAWFIRLGELTCPAPGDMDTALLAKLTGYAIDQCEVQVAEVSGLIDLCFEGPITPFTYEPAWAWFQCEYLRDEERSSWYLPVHFPPDFEGPKPERGDIVTLAGGLGVDTDRYGECTATVSGDIDISAADVALEQERFARSCARIFVVTDVTVTGHIDLEPL